MTRCIALTLLALAPAGCDLEWGGAEFALIDPAPVPIVVPDSTEAEAEVELPLPTGPFLYAVRANGDGTAWTTPIASFTADGLDSLALPGSFDQAYRERLDSRTLPSGLELVLTADGQRIGTLVLGETRRSVHAACPSVASGRLLLTPGDAPPEWSFAVEFPDGPGAVEAPRPRRAVVLDTRMRTFGPILTENLFEQSGEDRAYLAQRVELEPIAFPDGAPGMVGTYLVNDRIDGDGPTGRGASLFFVARYDPTKGYEPVWSEVRRYGGGAEGREIFVYRGAALTALGRIDFAERLGGQSPRLVASIERDDRRSIDWLESERCPAVDMLRSVGPSPAGGIQPAVAPGGADAP